MAAIEQLLEGISAVVWGIPLLALLFGTHLFLTFRLKFIQRHIGLALRLAFVRTNEGKGDISHFGALATALAATVGTGNIVGVATAVSLGGPGAVLWMWLTGVFGFATKYAEAVLSVKYRVVDANGRMAGGPMYVLERGMGVRWLAVIFAAMTAVAAFGIGNMVQANSLALLLEETLHVSRWMTGAAGAAATAAIILGGIRSIARACARLVPFMAVFYIVSCLVLLAAGWRTLPDTVLLIIKSAFSGQAALGAFAGAGVREALRYGVARGLFSNEAGLGSAPIVAAAAQTKNPVRQGLVSATGTFWDTVVICALTGLVIVNSGLWTGGMKGAALTRAAFAHFPVIGPAVLAVGLFTFVFSTIIGWSYYGEIAVEYIMGVRAVTAYRLVWVGAVFAGSVASLPAVWSFADIANALMAAPNLVSLLVLHGVVVAETRTYLWDNALDHAAGEEHAAQDHRRK